MFYWFGIVLAFVVASANNRQIVINDESDTWISLKNFSTAIEIALNRSICANVILEGNLAKIENIFKKFVQIYPYEYTINEKTYLCSGYLAISTSSEIVKNFMKRVPTKISTTEILIVIDDHVDESVGLFNVSMYENANLIIVAHNGLWSLSENFLHPRRFKKVSSYEEMVHKSGIVNLQGRELQAAALHYPPFAYFNSTVNRTVNNIEREIFVTKDEPNLDGAETKLFLLIADRLNFTWTLSKLNNYGYGRRNGTSWNYIIDQIFRKEIDIAFSGIWLALDHYLFANLTVPWIHLDERFLVPRPKPYTSFWALTRPLAPATWAAVIIMIVVQSVSVYTRAWVNPRIPKRFRSFVITWTELMARLVGASSAGRIEGLKFQFYLWHVIGILIVTAYSSSLAARLTSSDYEDRIDTFEQFITANLSWGSEDWISNFKKMFGESDPWLRRFESRFEHEASAAERHERIINGNYAIMGHLVGSAFFPENFVSVEDMKGYRVMKDDSIRQSYSSFAVQPWLLNSVDKIILRCHEGGLMVYQLNDVLRRHKTSAIYEVLIEHDGLQEGARVLELRPLAAAFSMLIVGLIVATVVFYFELRSVSDGRSIIDVLRDIAKKRKRHLTAEKNKTQWKNYKFRKNLCKKSNEW